MNDILFKYQGDEIAFSVKVYTDTSKTTLLNLDDVDEITVYIYTDGCKKALFSKTERDGYVTLGRSSSFEYTGILDSSITKLMAPGVLILEINLAKNIISIVWNIIRKASVGVLKKSLIKIES